MVFNRQRITLAPSGEGKPLALVDESKSLASYGVPEGAKLRLKDLGPQVAYRWLYLWEYVSIYHPPQSGYQLIRMCREVSSSSTQPFLPSRKRPWRNTFPITGHTNLPIFSSMSTQGHRGMDWSLSG